jgi:hypothetical protein
MPDAPGLVITCASTLLPGWVVIPIAAVVLVVTARHVLSVETSGLEPLRKRLRITNGLLMMLVATLLAYALGMAPVVEDAKAHPGEAKAFIVVWAGILGLLAIVVLLATADAIGTARVGMRARRELRADLRETLGKPGQAGSAGEPPRG